jgi:hypothetical protein
MAGALAFFGCSQALTADMPPRGWRYTRRPPTLPSFRFSRRASLSRYYRASATSFLAGIPYLEN